MDDRYTTVTVKVVATIGPDDAWAAYLGLQEWSSAEIATFGDKLSEGVAIKLLGDKLHGKRYRRGGEDAAKE